METLTFSNELTGALFALFFTCIMLPVLYYIWMAYRKRLNNIAMLAGIASFFVFGYFLSGFLLGTFAPEAKAAEIGVINYALRRAVCVAIAEAGGLWLSLYALSKRYNTIKVPTGLGLGFQLFNLLYLGGINSFIRLGYVMSVNKNDLQTVLDSVEAQYAPQFEALLRDLAASDPYVYVMSAVDYVCMFILTAALCRILWYSIEGGRKESSKLFIIAAFVLRLAAEIPLAVYQAGGGSYKLCAIFYYVITALVLAYAVWLSHDRDDKEQIRSDRLRPRRIRK